MIRTIEVYKPGTDTPELDHVEPVVVPDDLPTLEQIQIEVSETNDQALVAYQNFDSLTAPQKYKILKGLLGDYIARHPEKYL